MKTPPTTMIFTLLSVVAVVVAFTPSSCPPPPPPPIRRRFFHHHRSTARGATTVTTTTRGTRTRARSRRDIVGRAIEDNNQPRTSRLLHRCGTHDDENEEEEEEEEEKRFHPLGPPTYLSSLPVGGTTACRLLLPHDPTPSVIDAHDDDVDAESAACVITRLSIRPHVFLMRNGMSARDTSILMDGASRRGMTAAGTRSSPGGGGDSSSTTKTMTTREGGGDSKNVGIGAVVDGGGGVEDEGRRMRVGSYSTWIDPYDIGGLDDDRGDIGNDESASALVSVARGAISMSRRRFSHEAMNDIMDRRFRHDGKQCDDDDDSSYAEDMQVAMYVPGGGYDYHHDGYGRYLTVLSYLNGVGGTYFPFVDDDDVNISDDDAMPPGGIVECGGGSDNDDRRRGILIVGREGSNVYTAANSSSSSYCDGIRHRGNALVRPRSIIGIVPGDAIAFYNYDADGSRDMRSLHCSLTVPEEKWIATCWYRSEGLTGPFGLMKKARLRDEWTTRNKEDAQNACSS
jgi:hypothetical protein